MKPTLPLSLPLSLPLAFALALALPLAATACDGLYAGTLEGSGFAFPIAETTIDGQGPLGGILSALGIVFPFDQVIPSKIYADRSVTEVQLSTIAIRLTTPDDYDADHHLKPSRQKDADLVGPCTGTPAQTLDFLRSVDLFIQKNGSATKTRIAHYCNSTSASDCAAADRPAAVATNLCGIFFTIDDDPATGEPYELIPYLPDYTISTSAKGTAPVDDVTVTGFVGVDWYAPTVGVPR
ncbi:MAG TPA: hypothetical protein VHE35_36220 [Kofleriaceae bacterium]|nr:hypothetical protein [Kofleriaceae bacterium]